jgi:hypothetical protein
MRIASITFGIFSIIILSGCSQNDSDNANQLYVEASNSVRSFNAEKKSHLKALEHYISAKEKINEILTEYGLLYKCQAFINY